LINCPHCNTELTIIRAGRQITNDGRREKVYQMSTWLNSAGADTLERNDAPTAPASYFKQEPAREPTVQSDVVVPALRSIFTGFLVGTCTAGIAFVTNRPAPGAFAGMGFAVAATGSWLLDVAELKRLMWRKIEEETGRDLDGDGYIGEPPEVVERYVPYRAGNNITATDAVEPPIPPTENVTIELVPHSDRIEKHRLFDYLIGAFDSGDWSRDGDAKGIGCKKLGINTKIHPKVRDFVKGWDGVYAESIWGLTGEENRPTLDNYLRSLGWTGTNERERHERNEGT
jgi:hypothetical protein